MCIRDRYYRTRIKDANGKLGAIYAKTPEELYNKETLALEQINLYCSRQRTIMYLSLIHIYRLVPSDMVLQEPSFRQTTTTDQF